MNENILTVSEITGTIKYVLEKSFDVISVTGEISNFKHHSSGHRYFSLKDNDAQISCTMWRHRQIDFVPEDGMKVIIKGKITVYPPRGNYQIDCFSMQPAGKGDLYLAFEALKKKLEEKGYFDEQRKRTLPDMPLKVGVATSPTGAAVKDILSTLARRMPVCEIFLRPTVVQGDEASPDIAKAINDLNFYPVDLIIIGRGGGSIEDLWGFNTEEVAEAVINSQTPVISAVGHETDFTIADFCADIRAATPTAAAEIASRITKDNIIDNIDLLVNDIRMKIENKIERYKENLDFIAGKDMKFKLIEKINLMHQRNDELSSSMNKDLNYKLRSYLDKQTALESHLNSLNPLIPFEKGFALLKSGGEIIPPEESLAKFKNIEIIRKNENARATVKKILPESLF